jgi:ribosome-associated translation inhibitor RaiA
MARSMKLQFTYKNISESEQSDLADQLNALAKRHLEPYLGHLEPDTVHLRAVLERNAPHDNLQRVALKLTVPGGRLTSQIAEASMTAAAKKTFVKLERQLIEHNERMHQKGEWRRKERRARLNRLKAEVSERPP